MATLLNNSKLASTLRGNIQTNGNGTWAINMPMGIKNRRLVSFKFEFKSESNDSLVSMLRFSDSNAKLRKTAKEFEIETGIKIKLWAFNLPALLACPGALQCAFFCYALQGQFGYRNVMEARAFNFALLHELHARGGVELVTDALHNMFLRARVKTPKARKPWFRIHDSGDLFKNWYLEALCKAMSNSYGELDSYLYTKAIGLLRNADIPSNMRIVQSVGGSMDGQMDLSKSHSQVFATVEDRIAADYVDGNKSDVPAMLGAHKIGLVYHGTENLKLAA